MDREAFSNPAQEYRMKTIIHGWPDECGILADAVRDFGYGGTATNPPTETVIQEIRRIWQNSGGYLRN